MNRIALVVASAILCSSFASPAFAVGDVGISVNKSADKTKKKKPYHGSSISYQNVLSAYSLSQSAQQSYDPYYAMSWTFRPQYWLRDDMYVRARLGVEVELTSSESTDTKREPVLTDLSLAYAWNDAYTIPKADIKLKPTFTLALPTSKVSQARSMLFGLNLAIDFKRDFKLHSGKWFKSIGVAYQFGVGKPFNEYTTAQVDIVCGNISRPECQHSGNRNVNWSFTNTLVLTTPIHPKVSLTLLFSMINMLLYEGSEQQVELADGTVDTIPATDNNHNAVMVGMLDVTWSAFDWMSLSGGVQTVNNQLAPDSSYYVPLVNRNAMLYVTATFPIAPIVERFWN